ncbi:unnamed protein product [Rhizoctonia solani]|uniref:Tetratricopeptide repeat protein 29 n=1 Tax=Rhizoctonia solani TaxID=456999 RepID=A0A8H3GX81_9AGAM|nr:unnamed protein product [Rhizoctonia solani]
MSLTISYEPPEGGKVWYVDVALSESYEDVLNAACTLWRNRLPSDDCIIGRYLARQIKRHGETEWARISEARFLQLVQDTPEDLELRLELDIQTGRHYRDTSTPSSLEMPPPLLNIDGNNYGVHSCLDDSSSATEIATNNTHAPSHTPLTPTSLIGNSIRHYQAPSIVDSPTHQNTSNYPPSSATTATIRNATYEDGLNAFFAGRFSDARAHFQLAADECHDTGDAFQEAECLLRLGMTCRHLKDYPNAISHLSSARKIYESLDCRREQLQCGRNLARVSEDQNNYQEALRTYQEIKASARVVGSQTEEAWCDYSLGRLYNRMRQFDDALQHLSQAIRASQALKNQEIEAYATEESGHSAERQQRRELAIQCYERALAMFKTRGRGRWTDSENRVKKRLEHLGVKQSRSRIGSFFGRRQSTSAT